MDKKSYLYALLICAMCVGQNVSAQSFFSSEKADSPITLGVRAGMNLSTLTGKQNDDIKTGVGFNVGVSADFPIVKSLYIQSGLYYSGKTIKLDKESGTASYLQLPILASYRYDFSEKSQLQVNFGPYVAYGLGGELEKQKFFSDSDEGFGLKKFDAGLSVGAGYTYGNIFVGAQYEFGLTDISPKGGEGSTKTSNISINLGYNF